MAAALRSDEPMPVVDVKPDEDERACRSRAAAKAVVDRRFAMLDNNSSRRNNNM